MKYRRKPVVIEAFQLGTDAVPEWFTPLVSSDGHADIVTLEGTMRADAGDFVIKGVKGELYPCKPDIFAATYKADE